MCSDNAVDTVGEKGELKVVQWIRGSSLVWRGQINMIRMPFHMANHTITVRNGGIRLYVSVMSLDWYKNNCGL